MNAAAIIFLISSFLTFYVLAGYPLLLAVLARRARRPEVRGPAGAESAPSVSVVIAVRNGERWLAQKLDSVLALDYPASRIEIIVVSDGSVDRTEDIAGAFSSRGVQLIVVPPGGKPAALNAAVPHAAGD